MKPRMEAPKEKNIEFIKGPLQNCLHSFGVCRELIIYSNPILLLGKKRRLEKCLSSSRSSAQVVTGRSLGLRYLSVVL